jgi:hypothetical protein
MTPTFSYTFTNNTNTNPLYSATTYNPLSISPSSLQPLNWYYYLIKNDGVFDTLTNITLDPGYTWYMFLTAPGGSAGGSNNGGGGTGQIINVKLNVNTNNTTAISKLYLHPYNNINIPSSIPVQTFTTNTSFITTNSTLGAGTYNLYPGTCGSKSEGGDGGSLNTGTNDIDPGCIGSAGGGGKPSGMTFTGYRSDTYNNKYSSGSGDSITFTFSDGLKGSVIAGNMGFAGNISQVMFYCVANS